MKKSLVESPCSYSLTSRICWRLPLLQRLPRDWTYTQSVTESGRSSLVRLFLEREYRWGSGEGLLCQQAICERESSLSVDLQGGAGPAASRKRVRAAKPVLCTAQGAHLSSGSHISSPVRRGGGATGPWDLPVPRKGEPAPPHHPGPLGWAKWRHWFIGKRLLSG